MDLVLTWGHFSDFSSGDTPSPRLVRSFAVPTVYSISTRFITFLRIRVLSAESILIDHHYGHSRFIVTLSSSLSNWRRIRKCHLNKSGMAGSKVTVKRWRDLRGSPPHERYSNSRFFAERHTIIFWPTRVFNSRAFAPSLSLVSSILVEGGRSSSAVATIGREVPVF